MNTDPAIRPVGKSSPAGFTLIELLTVIAIVGVLAGILIPVVSRVRQSARASLCTSNLRQVHAGIMMYVGDNRGRFPDVMVRNEQGTAWVQWWKTIAPYLSVANPNRYPLPALQCPEVAKIASERLTATDRDSLPNYGLSTSIGRYQYDANNPIIPGSTALFANVRNPSRTLLAGDVGVGATSVMAFLDSTSVVVDGDKHADGSTLLWVDGHVSRWKNVSKLAEPPYSKGSAEDVWTP